MYQKSYNYYHIIPKRTYIKALYAQFYIEKHLSRKVSKWPIMWATISKKCSKNGIISPSISSVINLLRTGQLKIIFDWHMYF